MSLSYRTKIAIDRTLGIIVVVLLNGLTRLAGIILRRNHGPADKPKAIVVTKYVGLGSIVYTGALCHALKCRFPDTQLVYLTTRGCQNFVKRLSSVDYVLTIDDSNMVRMFLTTVLALFRLWRLQPELFFDMEVYSSWSAIIATLSLARNRYGFFRKSVVFKKGLHSHLIYFNTARHIAQIYAQMALAADCHVEDILLETPRIESGEEKEVDKILSELQLTDRSLVLINPNASELMLERRWPAQNWIEFLHHVAPSGQWYFLLVGSPNERTYVSSIFEQLNLETKHYVANVAGRFSLGGYLALIKKAVYIVTCDSGPLHFAIVLGTPSLSLWGPGDPRHYGLLNSNRHTIIYRDIYCSPCLYHADYPPCGGNNQCMKQISVEECVQAFEALTNVKIKNQLPKQDVHSHRFDVLPIANDIYGLVPR